MFIHENHIPVFQCRIRNSCLADPGIRCMFDHLDSRFQGLFFLALPQHHSGHQTSDRVIIHSHRPFVIKSVAIDHMVIVLGTFRIIHRIFFQQCQCIRQILFHQFKSLSISQLWSDIFGIFRYIGNRFLRQNLFSSGNIPVSEQPDQIEMEESPQTQQFAFNNSIIDRIQNTLFLLQIFQFVIDVGNCIVSFEPDIFNPGHHRCRGVFVIFDTDIRTQ